jgi:hypothetical protein
MTASMEIEEPLAKLLRSTVLADPSIMAQSISYAVENSTSALHNARHHVLLCGPNFLRAVFDWFTTLARAFSSVPTGKFRHSEDGLWLSKNVVISMRVLAQIRPDLVADFRARYTSGHKYLCGPVASRALLEMNFQGGLLRYVLTSNTFNTSALFSSGASFVRYAMYHARNNKLPLINLEMLCTSVFPSWSMQITSDESPWDRAWRVFEAAPELAQAHGAMSFRGQRRAASEFGPNSPKANWIMGSGNISPGAYWPSCMVPWLCPVFSEEMLVRLPLTRETASSGRKVAQVRSMLILAAVLDTCPEAYDLGLDAWISSPDQVRRLQRGFPHLTHVVEKVIRYSRDLEPPLTLCQNIVNEAVKFTTACKAKGAFVPLQIVESVRRQSSNDTALVIRLLRDDGRITAADAISAYILAQGPCDVFAFDKEGPVSWIDIVFSKARIWPKQYGARAPMASQGNNQHFIFSPKDREPPKLYSHPLTTLTHENNRMHPMWSVRTELLVACV